MVPVLESILKRNISERSVTISICIAVCGLFLLTAKDGLALDRGAWLCLMGAFFYAVYIIVLDKIAKKEDSFLISIIQLGVASALGAIFTCLLKPLLCRKPDWSGAQLSALA